MQTSITIQKHPELSDSSNYELLRQEGLNAIQQLASRWWTDYNIHDPGITQLELLCYALTDLGYRTSLDIKDLLAVPVNTPFDPKRQAFYTAREILTTNPWTVNDFRKLLIDIDGVKNGWLACKQCACDDLYIYANCKKSALQYEVTEHKITIKGLYDVLIEFEDEEGVGNLNSGKIKYNFGFTAGSNFATANIEMRLPSWEMIDSKAIISRYFQNDMVSWQKFLQLVHPGSTVTSIDVHFISGTAALDADITTDKLASRLRKPVYATFTVHYSPAADIASPILPAEIKFSDIPLTVWFNSDSDRKAMALDDLKTAISDASASGILSKYIDKIRRANEIIATTTQVLHQHRNLSEDYCTIKAIETEDIGVCTDMEVAPDVDIEAVLAEAYYQIDQYFSADIKFYSLTQLLAKGKAVDEIFEGPQLDNGFIEDEQLESTNLRRTLYTSDIINILMDIPGVKAVKNFALTRYNEDGLLVESQPWSLDVTYNHQPRLYVEASKFLVFKNGLPFLPDRLELADTMQVIIGTNAQPKLAVTDKDLPVPQGNYYDLTSYYPLQYSLPLTYGVGFDGLPSAASAKRRAQAKQLKAYLLFFEQMLVNYLEQLAHVKDLFAVDDTVTHSYFSHLFTNAEINGLNDIVNTSLTANVLQDLEETNTVFLDRRNRFLDHLLARFSETFSEYALMLYSYSQSKAVAQDELIKDKIAFLKDYPFMSYNKARSFNYKDPTKVCDPTNIAGLTTRIRRVLGMPDAEKIFVVEHLLLRPRIKPSTLIPKGDPLLSICIGPNCELCGEEDPYSFRLTVVLNGETGLANSGIAFRRFAEQTIRKEIPAHLAIKICWVEKAKLDEFETKYCAWLKELSKVVPDTVTLSNLLTDLLAVFTKLKNVYPAASLHDCEDGNDENRVFLNQTII
ncbi:hypothetical protein A4D02_29940 [Niastella koreensis]|uniref:Uncharacterized protein n=2 Tax=Niastella koreensis TaxID=354356 RepID=G8T6M6_NIAKG|nr:hypothetical protein [Niastella koreensis]AEV96871.1 hypothetical protein Niako_0473 [Niastella koreensis GR20-10]OQP49216.1 hypothetical protein A4D02_29940 [Niastella koreensis]